MEFDWRWSLIVCVIVFFGFLVGYGIHESFKMEAIEKSCEIDGMGFHYGDEFDYYEVEYWRLLGWHARARAARAAR